MKTLTTHTRILFMALVILATFFLSPIPCLADSPSINDVVVQPATNLVKVLTEPIAKGATGAIDAANKVVIGPVAKGAIDATNKVVIGPVAKGATGAIEVVATVATGAIDAANKLAIEPFWKRVAKPILKGLTFGLWDC